MGRNGMEWRLLCMEWRLSYGCKGFWSAITKRSIASESHETGGWLGGASAAYAEISANRLFALLARKRAAENSHRDPKSFSRAKRRASETQRRPSKATEFRPSDQRLWG